MGSERISYSWLEPGMRDGQSWRGFAGVERGKDTRWVWSIQGESALVFSQPANGDVYYTFVAPIPGTTVEVLAGHRKLRVIRTTRPWQEFSGKAFAGFGPDCSLRFVTDRWNGQPEPFAPEDGRALALLFKTLRFESRPEAGLPVKSRKICPYPFSKMEIYSPNFAPCCTWWLKEELAFEGNEGDPWNSGAAQALRRSVLEGTYEYCKLEICQAPLLEKHELERSEEFELPIAPENLAALRLGITEMPAGPSSVVVLADPRCNLACPSCRKGMITELSPQESQQIRETEAQLEAYREKLRVLVLASNGEVFYSPFLRLKLKEATRDRYPNLDYVEIISNGILFDEKSYDQLRPGSESIRKVRISVDAGDAPTYRKVRGGDWERLQKNLRWLVGLRREGRIENLRLNFVVRKENYRSLPAFFAMAEELGVDEVFISRVLPWTHVNFPFAEQDVFAEEHPERESLRALWCDLRSRDWSFRILGNVNATVESMGAQPDSSLAERPTSG